MSAPKPRKPKSGASAGRAKTAGSSVELRPFESRIYSLRGVRVMLDVDLAEIYGVPTFRLNEAVKRNLKRFPKDFIFQLGAKDVACLTSQITMSKPVGRGGRRTRPYAFTEYGALMLASVLNSPRAVEMSIYVVRAFVRLRQLMIDNQELSAKLAGLERKVAGAVHQLMEPPPARPRIGFQQNELPI